MRLVKVGIANINPTVGAIKSNAKLVTEAAHKMHAQGCTVVTFPEQVLSAYPVEDLIQWRRYVLLQEIEIVRFARLTETELRGTVFVIGVTLNVDDKPYNCAVVIQNGRILGVVPKEKLPDYNIFYESRTCSLGIPGVVQEVTIGDKQVFERIIFGDIIFHFPFGKMAVEVCEDIWSKDGPMGRRTMSGAELVVNLSASPFRAGVLNTRREMIPTRSADNQTTVVYTNLVGGQDALVFDGGGFVYQNGRPIFEAKRFVRNQVSTCVVDLERTARMRRENTTWRRDQENFMRTQNPVRVIECLSDPAPPMVDKSEYTLIPEHGSLFMPPKTVELIQPFDEYMQDILKAKVMGLRDYKRKSGAFKRYGVSKSGGRDSGNGAIFAKHAAREDGEELGLSGSDLDAYVKDHVYCFSFSTKFNSGDTKSLARDVCEALGVTFTEVNIQELVDLEIAKLRAIKRALGQDDTLNDTTLQNIQARVRGELMQNLANEFGLLWIQTGNMDEKATGYTTVGGDLMGALSISGNEPKTVIIEFLYWYAAETGLEPIYRLAAQKSSAELKENQADEDDLMPFPVLGACFGLFVGEKMDPVDVYWNIRNRWSDDEFRAMSARYEPGMLKTWLKRFFRLFFASVHKWEQAPLAIHLGSLDLDRTRAMQVPVVSSTEWLELERLDELPN